MLHLGNVCKAGRQSKCTYLAGDVSRRKIPTAEGLQLAVLIKRLLDAVLRFPSSATHSGGHLQVVEDAAEVR